MHKIVNFAIETAGKSKQSYKHGAVLFKGGKVHASSPNNYRHAEVDCISSLSRCKKVKNLRYNILVVRISPNGELVNSKPCQLCISHLRHSEMVKAVLYSDENGNIVKENINDITTDHLSKAVRNFVRDGGSIHEFKVNCSLH